MPPVNSVIRTDNGAAPVSLSDASFPPRAGTETQKFDPVADAKTLHGYMAGPGTDEEGLTTLLQSRTVEQIDRIRTSYRQQFGSTLVGDIAQELSQHDGYYDKVMSAIYGPEVWSLTVSAREHLGTGDLGTIAFNPLPALTFLAERDSATLKRVSRAYNEANSAKWAGTESGPNLRRDLQTWGEDPAYQQMVAKILSRLNQDG